jgi:pimeloyl-ACP methyl ester carboxylesterase
MKNKILTFSFVLLAGSLMAQVSGNWKGEIYINKNKQIGIETDFSAVPDKALLSIPEQSAYSLQLSNLNFTKTKAYFEFNAGRSVLVFDGGIVGDSIKGKYTQGKFESTFYLVQSNKVSSIENALDKGEREVTFSHNNITLSGTLAIPELKQGKVGKAQKFPAVILVSGSGQQTRDSDIFGFKVFKTLSDSLVAKGIAVLRYDDRGVGQSGGDPQLCTTFDFVDDANAAIDFLKGQKHINPNKIGVIGHSEGGVIAANLASKRKDLAFVVTMAGPAKPGDEILLEQNQKIAELSGMPQKKIDEANELNKKFYAGLKNNASWESLEDVVGAYLKSEIDAVPGLDNKEEVFAQKLQGLKDRYETPWVKAYVKHDPYTDLLQSNCPVLGLFGGKDVQVLAQSNTVAMESAFKKNGGNKSKTIVYAEANHLFQKANTGLPQEYPNLGKQFVNGFIDDIVAWVLKE